MSFNIEQEIALLKDKLLHLSSIVEKQFTTSFNAFLKKDKELSISIQPTDSVIDEKEVEIEEDCLKLLALKQPVAKDLRFIVCCLKINNDLERIGDLSVNISKRNLSLIKNNYPVDPYILKPMFDVTSKMFCDSIKALIQLDAKLSYEICKKDDEVDAINKSMFTEVEKRLQSEPENSTDLINFLSIVRNIERIADYSTNIAEDVIYLVEGKIVRHKSLQNQVYSL